MHKIFVIICLSRESLSGECYWNSALVPLSLAEIVPVIFFEPPWEVLLGIAKNPIKWFHKFKYEKSIIKHRKLPKMLKTVKLFSIFPWGWQNRWTKKINQTFVLLQIKWHIRNYPPSKRILLTYWRETTNLIKKIPVYRRIYHCTDEIAGFPWPSEKAKQYAIMKEAKVAQIVDLVLVTSPTLIKRMSVYNKNVKLLANDAVDFEFFNIGLSMPFPEELKNLQKPIVGYVGNLSKFKQDFNLIKKIAISYPEWTFVFVGAFKVDLNVNNNEIPRLRNIIYLGSKKREKVPRYIAAFDICIIPHKNNLYNQHSFPMKFFEYLALGKPVVATDMPALSHYKKYVYIAKNPEEFVKYLKLALEEDSPKKQKERIKFASAHSWKNRGPKILKLLLE